MSRNFGMIRGRAGLSGAQAPTRPLAARSNTYRADSNSFASQHPPYDWSDYRDLGRGLFIPADTPFKRGQFAQALIDILAMAFGIFFVCAAACSVPVALFMLFFCKF